MYNISIEMKKSGERTSGIYSGLLNIEQLKDGDQEKLDELENEVEKVVGNGVDLTDEKEEDIEEDEGIDWLEEAENSQTTSMENKINKAIIIGNTIGEGINAIKGQIQTITEGVDSLDINAMGTKLRQDLERDPNEEIEQEEERERKWNGGY